MMRRVGFKMKITHIPKDKLIEIRYEGNSEKWSTLTIAETLAKVFGIEVEELKQIG